MASSTIVSIKADQEQGLPATFALFSLKFRKVGPWMVQILQWS